MLLVLLVPPILSLGFLKTPPDLATRRKRQTDLRTETQTELRVGAFLISPVTITGTNAKWYPAAMEAIALRFVRETGNKHISRIQRSQTVIRRPSFGAS